MATKRTSSDQPTKAAPKAALPKLCENCGQEVKGQVALDSAVPTIKYCKVHGVRLRPDGTCPLEDD